MPLPPKTADSSLVGDSRPPSCSASSDTPETDKRTYNAHTTFGPAPQPYNVVVDAEFAMTLERQRNALAKDLFSSGPGTERTKQARCEAYLRLIEKGFPHAGARDAANQLIHVG